MSSYRCPKCSTDHRMYDPPIEMIHSDLFAEPEWEDEKFDTQPGDVSFEDEIDEY